MPKSCFSNFIHYQLLLECVTACRRGTSSTANVRKTGAQPHLRLIAITFSPVSALASAPCVVTLPPPVVIGSTIFNAIFSNHPANVTNEQGMTQLHVDLKAWGSVLLQLHRRLPEAV
jgi:hypothetical protein